MRSHFLLYNGERFLMKSNSSIRLTFQDTCLMHSKIKIARKSPHWTPSSTYYF